MRCLLSLQLLAVILFNHISAMPGASTAPRLTWLFKLDRTLRWSHDLRHGWGGGGVASIDASGVGNEEVVDAPDDEGALDPVEVDAEQVLDDLSPSTLSFDFEVGPWLS